jgi:hypothetical protein
MHFLRTRAHPQPGYTQFRAWQEFEPKGIDIEPPRSIDVGDVDGHVMDSRECRHR